MMEALSLHASQGKKEAVEFIDRHRENSKPLAWAFLRAMDASSAKEWMFNEIEKDLHTLRPMRGSIIHH